MIGKYNGKGKIGEEVNSLEKINCWLKYAYAIDDIIESKSVHMKKRIRDWNKKI